MITINKFNKKYQSESLLYSLEILRTKIKYKKKIKQNSNW